MSVRFRLRNVWYSNSTVFAIRGSDWIESRILRTNCAATRVRYCVAAIVLSRLRLSIQLFDSIMGKKSEKQGEKADLAKKPTSKKGNTNKSGPGSDLDKENLTTNTNMGPPVEVIVTMQCSDQDAFDPDPRIISLTQKFGITAPSVLEAEARRVYIMRRVFRCKFYNKSNIRLNHRHTLNLGESLATVPRLAGRQQIESINRINRQIESRQSDQSIEYKSRVRSNGAHRLYFAKERPPVDDRFSILDSIRFDSIRFDPV